ncbi:nucleotide-diphospho-sugar transferase [Mucilaginibacter terrae]|uniref:Nucleotide-diphospho-sugar transferase n=1 Tax=Mucilaginibacter terrae TaxID=1955052 RepID=A0ABU3GWH0_9SPHI|nr:nucleotide-diphospho-sugar transferase [Mucilaginibacter terrae]MDT3403946.1 hypothetical protein [Mucilaginibacter terrae]
MSASNYNTLSPVLFIVFNRPDTTKIVFDAIAAVRPKALYIAADGPRQNKDGETEKCEQVRKITQQVTWPCKVETLYRTQNLGCKDAVSSAITWFFEQEEEGIILEDDCVPSADFFRFCDDLLAKYRDDTRVSIIGGTNLHNNQLLGNGSYYFSTMTIIWGWASWRRVWNKYDTNLSCYELPEAERQLEKVLDNQYILQNWTEIFSKLKAGEIDTWDYQFAIINYFENMVSILPNYNLISNIGHGAGATHTLNPDNAYSKIPYQQLPLKIIHPKYILPEYDADAKVLNQMFDVDNRMKKDNHPRRKFKRWLKTLFK